MKRKIGLRTRIGKEKEEPGRLEHQCPASCPSGLRGRKVNPGIKGNSDFDRISAVFLPPTLTLYSWQPFVLDQSFDIPLVVSCLSKPLNGNLWVDWKPFSLWQLDNAS